MYRICLFPVICAIRKLCVFSSRLLQAVTEVADALVSTGKLYEKMSMAADQLVLLQKAVPDARLVFSNGMADYLEVITVQQQLLQQQLDIADLKRQKVTAYIQLYRSPGGGT